MIISKKRAINCLNKDSYFPKFFFFLKDKMEIHKKVLTKKIFIFSFIKHNLFSRDQFTSQKIILKILGFLIWSGNSFFVSFKTEKIKKNTSFNFEVFFFHFKLKLFLFSKLNSEMGAKFEFLKKKSISRLVSRFNFLSFSHFRPRFLLNLKSKFFLGDETKWNRKMLKSIELSVESFFFSVNPDFFQVFLTTSKYLKKILRNFKGCRLTESNYCIVFLEKFFLSPLFKENFFKTSKFLGKKTILQFILFLKLLFLNFNFFEKVTEVKKKPLKISNFFFRFSLFFLKILMEKHFNIKKKNMLFWKNSRKKHFLAKFIFFDPFFIDLWKKTKIILKNGNQNLWNEFFFFLKTPFLLGENFFWKIFFKFNLFLKSVSFLFEKFFPCRIKSVFFYENSLSKSEIFNFDVFKREISLYFFDSILSKKFLKKKGFFFISLMKLKVFQIVDKAILSTEIKKNFFFLDKLNQIPLDFIIFKLEENPFKITRLVIFDFFLLMFEIFFYSLFPSLIAFTSETSRKKNYNFYLLLVWKNLIDSFLKIFLGTKFPINIFYKFENFFISEKITNNKFKKKNFKPDSYLTKKKLLIWKLILVHKLFCLEVKEIQKKFFFCTLRFQFKTIKDFFKLKEAHFNFGAYLINGYETLFVPSSRSKTHFFSHQPLVYLHFCSFYFQFSPSWFGFFLNIQKKAFFFPRRMEKFDIIKRFCLQTTQGFGKTIFFFKKKKFYWNENQSFSEWKNMKKSITIELNQPKKKNSPKKIMGFFFPFNIFLNCFSEFLLKDCFFFFFHLNFLNKWKFSHFKILRTKGKHFFVNYKIFPENLNIRNQFPYKNLKRNRKIPKIGFFFENKGFMSHCNYELDFIFEKKQKKKFLNGCHPIIISKFEKRELFFFFNSNLSRYTGFL